MLYPFGLMAKAYHALQ